jgi:hypothetical protein
LKDRSERIEGGFGFGKGERAGGLGKTTIFYLPSLTIQNRGRFGQGDRPVEGGGVPATRCTATAGKWGKTKRSSRATDSAPYLGLGCSGGADRRPAVGLLAVVTGAALVVVMEGSGRRGNWSWRCGARWGAGPALLYTREGRFDEDILSFAELQWPAMEVREKSWHGL